MLILPDRTVAEQHNPREVMEVLFDDKTNANNNTIGK